MKRSLLLGAALAVCISSANAASWLERLGFGRSPAPASPLAVPLSADEMSGGLKQALAKGVEQAVAMLGKPDGFLKDASVRIPVPEKLQIVERTLRTLHQDQLADQFVTSMNRAAEKAVPEAAAVLSDSVKQMTLADAKTILTSTNNAATAYFRRTSETNLFERFLPIVQKTTEETGVTRTYKQMIGKANFGGFSASSLLGEESADLDRYVTHKTMDGLFAKIAEQEKLIRENPAARTTELLQKVFGAIRPASAGATR